MADQQRNISDKKQRWLQYNEDLEKLFESSRQEWNSKVDPLYDGIAKAKPEDITQLEATSLSMRQNITEEIAYFKTEMGKTKEKGQMLRKDKVLEYVSPDKRDRQMVAAMNAKYTDKKVLMAGELAFIERTIDMYKNHLEFLIETREVLKSYSYTIKNKLEALDLMLNK